MWGVPMARLDAPPTPPPQAATHGPAPATQPLSAALTRDTELLSAALNGVLEEQAGRVFASRVQWLFRTAEIVRGGDKPAAERLPPHLAGGAPHSAQPS